VIHEIAISFGRSSKSIRSSSMTTDVSIIPRSCTRLRILIDGGVEIAAEAATSDSRGSGEHGGNALGGYEPSALDRNELAYRDAVSCDDERLPAVERAHDLSALVPELPLGDLARHAATVARVLRRPKGERRRPRPNLRETKNRVLPEV